VDDPHNDRASDNIVDIEAPSAARIYDYLLGGGHNFAADRRFAERQMALLPNVKLAARSNRAFLRRAVRYAIGQGIAQFLDIGSGVPTVGNVHEIACGERPDARCVYVDKDPVAVAHFELLLGESSPHAIVEADFCDPGELLSRVEDTGVLDFDQPIALLVVALLPFVGPQLQPERHLARYREVLPPGSLLVMSHMTDQGVPEPYAGNAEEFRKAYEQTSTPGCYRTRDELTALFGGDFQIVAPGVVWAQQWRPEWPDDRDPAQSMILAGVACKAGGRAPCT
jgi:hypothetical protein